jgi:transposase
LTHRQALTGILFVLKTGIIWNDLPQELHCGSGSRCRRRLAEWHQAGVWRRVRALLLAELEEADKIDWARADVTDSSAHHTVSGEEAAPNPCDRQKKHETPRRGRPPLSRLAGHGGAENRPREEEEQPHRHRPVAASPHGQRRSHGSAKAKMGTGRDCGKWWIRSPTSAANRVGRTTRARCANTGLATARRTGRRCSTGRPGRSRHGEIPARAAGQGWIAPAPPTYSLSRRSRRTAAELPRAPRRRYSIL